jgi:hypothetical protein
MLLEMAQPDLYRRNDFRVLSLPTRVTERDIQKYLRRMQLAQKFGDAAQSSGAQHNTSGPLPLVPPPGAELLAEAQSRLSDAELRLISEFVWFWSEAKDAGIKADHFDAGETRDVDEALLALSRNDIESAKSLWTKQVERGGDEQGIAAHNMAVMFHVAALDIEWAASNQSPLGDELKQQRDDYWANSIEMWTRLLSSERAWDYLMARAEELNDPRLRRATVRQLRASLPVALLTINARLAVRASQGGETAEAKRQTRLIEQFAFAPDVVAEARQYALEPLRHRIYDLCQTTEKEVLGKPEQAAQFASQLLDRARPLLIAFDDLLPAGDSQRADVLDAVALTVNDAVILRASSMAHGSKVEWQSSQQLLERVSRYAATLTMRSRINESLVWVQDNVRYSDYKSCWFCSEQEGRERDLVLVRLYKMVAYKRYEYYDAPVPRCGDCWAAHIRVEKLTGWFGIGGALIGVIISLCVFVSFNDVMDGLVLWAVILFPLALAALAAILGNKQAWKKIPKKIKPQKHKMNHPTIKELLSKGWTNQKPA